MFWSIECVMYGMFEWRGGKYHSFCSMPRCKMNEYTTIGFCSLFSSLDANCKYRSKECKEYGYTRLSGASFERISPRTITGWLEPQLHSFGKHSTPSQRMDYKPVVYLLHQFSFFISYAIILGSCQ